MATPSLAETLISKKSPLQKHRHDPKKTVSLTAERFEDIRAHARAAEAFWHDVANINTKLLAVLDYLGERQDVLSETKWNFGVPEPIENMSPIHGVIDILAEQLAHLQTAYNTFDLAMVKTKISNICQE